MNQTAYTRAVLLAFFCLASCFGQGGEGDPPSNTWQRYTVYPWETVRFKGCAYYQDATGVKYPIPNTPFQWVETTKRYSGFHGHDTGGSNGSSRPLPLIDRPSNLIGLTDSTGCTPSLTVQLPGFAGWYTYECRFAGGVRSDGINFYGQSYTVSLPNPLTHIPFQHYPDDTSLNLSQMAYADPAHQTAGNSANFWLAPPVITLLQGVSHAYMNFQQTRSPQPFITDKIALSRCSIPHGGFADNDYLSPTGSPEWRMRAAEGHEKGLECDMANPRTYVTNQTDAGADESDLIASIVLGHCALGAQLPDNTGPATVAFWRSIGTWHVTCSPGAAIFLPNQPH